MKTFLIPYSYRCCGVVEIVANSLEEARDMALEASVDNDPRNEFFADDSFEIDHDLAHEVKEDESV